MREGRHQTPIHFTSILMGYPTTFRLTDFPSYVLCLVCHFEWVTSRKGESRSSKLFEELSCLATARCFGEQAVNFDCPQNSGHHPSSSDRSVVCAYRGRWSSCPDLQPQDDKLDVVWKD